MVSLIKVLKKSSRIRVRIVSGPIVEVQLLNIVGTDFT
jgi:hypothetical protein